MSDSPGPNPPLVLEIVTPATLPDEAESPRPRNNTFFGAVIGLALGVGAVVVVHSLDDRIRRVSDLPRSSHLATVTSLPTPRTRGPRSSRAGDVRLESFRHLRANLQFGTRASGLMAVAGVTSASSAEEVGSQLAAVLGEIDLNVLLVDADLRPRAGRRDAGPAPSAPPPGVADVLAGAATVEAVLRPSGTKAVWSIPAGTVTPTSAQQVSTPAMREMLLSLAERFDFVLVVCPPVVERSEASVIAALSRSTLLVVESGATTRSELLYALELLEGVEATSVSVALDHVRGLDLGRTPLPDPAAPAVGGTDTR